MCRQLRVLSQVQGYSFCRSHNLLWIADKKPSRIVHGAHQQTPCDFLNTCPSSGNVVRKCGYALRHTNLNKVRLSVVKGKHQLDVNDMNLFIFVKRGVGLLLQHLRLARVWSSRPAECVTNALRLLVQIFRSFNKTERYERGYRYRKTWPFISAINNGSWEHS